MGVTKPKQIRIETVAAYTAVDHLGIDSTAVLGYSQGGAIAQQLALDHPKRCDRLVLACTYAFNMATVRERLEGHLLPLLVHVLGPRRRSSGRTQPSSCG